MSKRVHRQYVKRMVAEAVNDALNIFCGTRAIDVPPRAFCDERLWASICWRIGPNQFLDAIYGCSQDIKRMNKPISGRARTKYFQAYLERNFPSKNWPCRSVERAEGGAR